MTRATMTAALVALLAGTAAGQQTSVIFVNDDAAPGGNGSSWDTAYRHLQDALGADVQLPREIHVAQGTYYPDRSASAPTGTGDRLAVFGLTDDTIILGGYPDPIDDADADDVRNPAVYITTLSGDLAMDDTNDPASIAENSYRIIETWNTNNTAVLDGFVISAGHANRPTDDGWFPARRDDSGGGMIVVDSEAVVRHCVFERNIGRANASVLIAQSGPFHGVEAGAGAVLIVGGAPVFTDCDFRNNSANRIGGAVAMYRSHATLERCDFIGNTIGLPGFGDSNWGGALADSSGVFGSTERAAVIDSRFVGNRVQGLGGGGGAISIIFANTDYTNCLVLANTSIGWAGGILGDNGTFVRFTNCAVIGNHAASRPGGFYDSSEVSDIYIISNSIFWGNTSDMPQGFNQNMGSGPGNIALHDSIVQNIFNALVATFEQSRVFDVDPEFIDPVGPDGIMWTGDENVRSLPGSPAHDSGNNARVPNFIVADLDGNSRYLDDPYAANTGLGGLLIVDMGPYEHKRCAADVNLDGFLTPTDFTAWINAFNNLLPECDQNGDGNCTPTDFTAWIANFNAGC